LGNVHERLNMDSQNHNVVLILRGIFKELDHTYVNWFNNETLQFRFLTLYGQIAILNGEIYIETRREAVCTF